MNFLALAKTEHWLERDIENEFPEFVDNSITKWLSLTNLYVIVKPFISF